MVNHQQSAFAPKSPQEEIVRAGQAKEILHSALFMEVREHIESMLRQKRRAVPVTQTELHTQLIITEQIWGNLVDWFDEIVQTGHLAEVQIQQQNRPLTERLFGVRR